MVGEGRESLGIFSDMISSPPSPTRAIRERTTTKTTVGITAAPGLLRTTVYRRQLSFLLVEHVIFVLDNSKA
jgi:hypothetical protein